MTKSKKKRLYSGTSYESYLYSVNIKKMNNKQLREYIRNASKEFEKSRNSDFDAVNTSYRFIAKKYGTRRSFNKDTGRYESHLTLKLKEKNREELREMAYQLQGHIRIDAYTNEGRKRWRAVTDDILESLEENTGVKLTRKQYNELRHVIAGIRDIIEKFGSDAIAKIYEHTVNSGGKGINLINVLRNVYESRSDGWDKDDLTQAAYDAIDNLLSKGEM